MPIDAYNSTIAGNYNNQYNSNQVNEALSSGRKVNDAADNAAGLAIINSMSTQIQSMDTGSQNALSGIGLLQTADGAASGMTENLQRMRELGLQALNGTLNQSQRDSINQEFQQLYQGMQDISENTKFNGQNILNGEISSMNIQVGESSSTLNLPDLSGQSLAIDGLSLSTPGNASSAMESIDQALESLSSTRAEYGAQQNGLVSAYDNLQTQNANTQASRSQLQDTDYFNALAEQSRNQVLEQASLAMQAQGNQNAGQVLQLLSS